MTYEPWMNPFLNVHPNCRCTLVSILPLEITETFSDLPHSFYW